MTDQKATVLLEHHLKALRLPTILREYGPVAAACCNAAHYFSHNIPH